MRIGRHLARRQSPARQGAFGDSDKGDARTFVGARACSARRVLDQHELDQAALVPADLAKYKIQTIGGRGKPVCNLDTGGRIPIAEAACQPVYNMTKYRTG